MAGNVQVNRHGSVSIGGRGYDAAPAAPTNGATAQEQTDLMARLASLEAVMQQINIDEVSSVPPPPAPRYRAPSTAPAPAYPQYGGACDAPVEVPGEDESDDDLEFNIHGSGGGGAPPASVPQEYGGAVDSFSAAQGDIERDLMAEIDALALSVPSEVAPLAPVAAAPQRHAMQGSIGESTERLESLLNASDMDAYAEQPLPARAASQPSVRVSRHGSISISSLPPPMPPPASLPPTISSYDRAMDDLAALREEQAGYAQEPEKLIDGAPDAVAAIDSLPPRYRADVQALGDLRDLLQLELPSEPPRGNVRGARTKNRDAARSRRSTSTKRAAAGSPARGGRANMSQNVRERRHIRVRPSNVAKPIVRKYRSAESAQKAPRSGGGGARQMETQLLELEADLRLTSLRRDNLDTAVAAEKRELFNKLVQLKNLRTHVDELQDALEVRARCSRATSSRSTAAQRAPLQQRLTSLASHLSPRALFVRVYRGLFASARARRRRGGPCRRSRRGAWRRRRRALADLGTLRRRCVASVDDVGGQRAAAASARDARCLAGATRASVTCLCNACSRPDLRRGRRRGRWRRIDQLWDGRARAE